MSCRQISHMLTALIMASAIVEPGCAMNREPLFERTQRVYLDTPATLMDSSMILVTAADLPESLQQLTLDLRLAMHDVSERRGMANAYWGMDLIAGDDTLTLTVRFANSDFGDILDRRETLLTLSAGERVVAKATSGDFASSSGAYNDLLLRVIPERGEISVSGGADRQVELLTAEIGFVPQSLILWSRGKMELSSAVVEKLLDPQQELQTDHSLEELKTRLRTSTDPIEGFWEYLDRENDPRYARMGGRYLLATIRKDEEPGYDIVYLDGAETWRERWKPGMIKGSLTPTIFENHFDLQWLDSEFQLISRDIHADVTDRAILTLSFPLLKTRLRFSKAVGLLKAPDHEKSQADEEN